MSWAKKKVMVDIVEFEEIFPISDFFSSMIYPMFDV